MSVLLELSLPIPRDPARRKVAQQRERADDDDPQVPAERVRRDRERKERAADTR